MREAVRESPWMRPTNIFLKMAVMVLAVSRARPSDEQGLPVRRWPTFRVERLPLHPSGESRDERRLR